MLQVKIFTEIYEEAVEKEANRWLATIDQSKIVKTESFQCNTNGYYGEVRYTLTIWYTA